MAVVKRASFTPTPGAGEISAGDLILDSSELQGRVGEGKPAECMLVSPVSWILVKARFAPDKDAFFSAMGGQASGMLSFSFERDGQCLARSSFKAAPDISAHVRAVASFLQGEDKGMLSMGWSWHQGYVKGFDGRKGLFSVRAGRMFGPNGTEVSFFAEGKWTGLFAADHPFLPAAAASFETRVLAVSAMDPSGINQKTRETFAELDRAASFREIKAWDGRPDLTALWTRLERNKGR